MVLIEDGAAFTDHDSMLGQSEKLPLSAGGGSGDHLGVRFHRGAAGSSKGLVQRPVGKLGLQLLDQLGKMAEGKLDPDQLAELMKSQDLKQAMEMLQRMHRYAGPGTGIYVFVMQRVREAIDRAPVQWTVREFEMNRRPEKCSEEQASKIHRRPGPTRHYYRA